MSLVRHATAGTLRRCAAFLTMLFPTGLMATIWTLVFFIW